MDAANTGKDEEFFFPFARVPAPAITNQGKGFFFAVTGAAAVAVAVYFGHFVEDLLAIKTPAQLLDALLTMSLLILFVWPFIAASAAIPFLPACRIAYRFRITHVAYFLACGAMAGILAFAFLLLLVARAPLSAIPFDEDLVRIFALSALPGLAGAFVFWWTSVRPNRAR